MAQRKVVVRAVALLSAKTRWKVANSLEICFQVKQQNRSKNRTKTPTTSLPESAEAGDGSLFLGRSDQGLGNAEHACQPSEGEGNACSIGWKMLQFFFWEQKVEYLLRVCSANRARYEGVNQLKFSVSKRRTDWLGSATDRTIPRSWKATKTFPIIGQNNERIDQTNSKTNQSSAKECVRESIPESRHQWCT